MRRKTCHFLNELGEEARAIMWPSAVGLLLGCHPHDPHLRQAEIVLIQWHSTTLLSCGVKNSCEEHADEVCSLWLFVSPSPVLFSWFYSQS